LRVAVLMGGVGEERQVSLRSGACVAEALAEAGFEVVSSDVGPDRLDVLEEVGIDLFFPVLHGRFGEDGQLQQILEDRSLVYAGSGPRASRLAFDKAASKKLFARRGLCVPAAVEFGPGIDETRLEERLEAIGAKFVVKPTRQGSSVGISIVEGAGRAIEVARQTAESFGDCLIEQFIAGREITAGVLGQRALPLVEIRPRKGFYDYHAKYLDDATEYICDPIADAALVQRIQAAALDCFCALGCKDFARVDFILGADGRAYALEVNTIPGFTKHSLLPKAAAAAGLSMSRLCASIVAAALASAPQPRAWSREATSP